MKDDMGKAIKNLTGGKLSPVALRELDRMRRIWKGEQVETKEESMRILGLRR